MSPQIPSGTTIGRYEIRSQIGAGGMGEVYLARDTELDRMVALKILPVAVAADQQRMRRFVQEAKSASSLNHQNIITIYEIGEADSIRFIATEFVEGITLRQHLKRGRLALGEVFEIGIQIASGLAAAHEAGLVHRDIKPENIMLRSRDGFVKVLDFGLVKLTEAAANTTDTEAPTRALVNTDAGTVMGTVVYMSPEQARGKQVDARTDIWSLGVILYEMVTGATPFSGESSADVIAAIVKSEPPAISRMAPDAPEKLVEIISKALEKDADDRYQTIKDLLVDLRRLKKRLDFESEMGRSATTAGPHSIHDSLSATTISSAASQTVSTDSVRPSSAEYIVSEIKRHKTGALLAIIGVLMLTGAAIFAWTKYSTPTKPTVAHSMKIEKLTSGGRVNGVPIDGSTSISPDGKYVVYTLIDAGKVSVWVRQISTGSDVQIVPPILGGNNGTTISRDGEFVYYVAQTPDDTDRTLYRVPILGGTPRRVLEHVQGPISFSPDGSQFTFVRQLPTQGGDALMVANADGSNDRTLMVRKGNDWFGSSGPAWSPDGNTIACSAGTDSGGTTYMTVMGYSLRDGSLKPLTSHKWLGEVRRLLWLPDGKGIVVPAQSTGQFLSRNQLYLLSQPDGEVTRITNDLNGYGNVSLGLTGDGNTIVTVQSVPSVQLWTMNFGEPSNRAVQISHGEVDGSDGVEWMGADQIVFVTQTGERADLSLVKADGSGTRSLISENGTILNPSVSPDGKYIFFSSTHSGTFHIWRINADGTNLKQITAGDFADFSPTCSPDGQSILFASLRSGKQCLWRMPFNGGDPVQFTNRPSTQGVYSRDGKFIAAGYASDEARGGIKLGIFPAAGGEPIKLIDVQSANLYAGLAWTPDGKSVIYYSIQNGVGNLWKQPIDGGAPQQITNFTSDLIYYFALSPDGKRLALSRGHATLDIVLIKEFH
jgi:eukaryotic-like serine/threonine-protein kinase